MDKAYRIARTTLEWYDRRPECTRLVTEIVERRHDALTLRVVDFFVTRYAQANRVVIPDPSSPGDFLDVFGSYKDSLRCYHKRLFDPFNRIPCGATNAGRKADGGVWLVFAGHRDDPKAGAETATFRKVPALKQLVFFKWAIASGVLGYIEKHVLEVDAAMKSQKGRRRIGPTTF